MAPENLAITPERELGSDQVEFEHPIEAFIIKIANLTPGEPPTVLAPAARYWRSVTRASRYPRLSTGYRSIAEKGKSLNAGRKHQGKVSTP